MNSFKISLLAGTVAVAIFAAGRNSVPRDEPMLPSVPIAFVQATQPIAITINVDLSTMDGAGLAKSGIHELRGSATYTFVNLTDKVVSIAFPPTRTFSISEYHFGRDLLPCPEALLAEKTFDIPANDSLSFSGPWGSTVLDLDTRLQGGAGWNGFTFSSPEDKHCFSGTLIAFQTFTGVKSANRFRMMHDHLRLLRQVSGAEVR